MARSRRPVIHPHYLWVQPHQLNRLQRRRLLELVQQQAPNEAAALHAGNLQQQENRQARQPLLPAPENNNNPPGPKEKAEDADTGDDDLDLEILELEETTWFGKCLDILGTAVGVIAFLVYFTGLALFAIGLTGEHAETSWSNSKDFNCSGPLPPESVIQCPSRVIKSAGMALLSLSVPLMFMVAIPYLIFYV